MADLVPALAVQSHEIPASRRIFGIVLVEAEQDEVPGGGQFFVFFFGDALVLGGASFFFVLARGWPRLESFSLHRDGPMRGAPAAEPELWIRLHQTSHMGGPWRMLGQLVVPFFSLFRGREVTPLRFCKPVDQRWSNTSKPDQRRRVGKSLANPECGRGRGSAERKLAAVPFRAHRWQDGLGGLGRGLSQELRDWGALQKLGGKGFFSIQLETSPSMGALQKRHTQMLRVRGLRVSFRGSF